QINVRKGQLQRWDKLTAFATLTVSLRTRKDYVAPVAPDFGGRVGRVFVGSLEALRDAGEFVVLAVVALAPWLGGLGARAPPPLLVWRRRRRAAAPAPPAAPPAG